MNYQTYLRSPEWEAKRKEKLESCQYKCECEGGCHRQATQIHHLHYDTLGNEDLQDLQALCAKCHMKKSNARGFYGNVPRGCCQLELLTEHEKPEKILPYNVYHEANFHYTMNRKRYEQIAAQLETEPIIAALLDNLGIMFACEDIAVEEKTTKAIERFADVVDASEADLDGYCDVAYKIKSEFEHHFIEENMAVN